MDCNTVIGESVCIEAHIFPDTLCFLPPPSWSGAFVEVDVSCQDSIVRFYLENTGTADMTNMKEYIVIEDAILLKMEDFQLASGQLDSFSIPGNGATLYTHS